MNGVLYLVVGIFFIYAGSLWGNGDVYKSTICIQLKNQPPCLCRNRQVRPEIIIMGALKYEGESTVWREYEVSDGTM